ncbi:cilia- and flagella-associated protein 44 [Pseudomyrmex gracilis]|uniref:cilia- and flagella-associated protein 44 n=1 Tax=Pseudomyrmex gracilis TaxID=219809 RepID=UPI00099499B1|nr:cilia- and flagella-associated protein 44 [Pseudomyrmex gracilis]
MQGHEDSRNDKDGKADNKEILHRMIYDSRNYTSEGRRVSNGTVPLNILKFHHSFSYDCQRYFNLCVVEPDVVLFASGNILHFFNTTTRNVWFRRGCTGSGIGHVTKNPVFDHIAVGENGENPPIIIYKWPSMEIVTILHDGTLKRYSHLAYSTNGSLLVSQGGEPDYTIVLWDWQRSKIALKCKSHNRDVHNVIISPSLTGYLATSGSGHIKFWKISNTFTGLKLKGEIGRFGQTEISDIIGVYIMPDGKIVSGCEWGNILLWEEGLITLEVCKKNRQPCHNRAITQFEYINGELISLGMDGWIRIWFYETIDQMDVRDEERFLEIQPIYEYHISENDKAYESMLMCMRKREPNNPESTLWYVQDGNGGIWLIDLDTAQQVSRKIFTCSAGAIVDMASATWGPFVAALSAAGQLLIYNYTEKRLILAHRFNDVGSQVVWFPCQIEATGSTLVCAFGSGVVRVIVAAISEANAVDDINGDYVRLIQVIRPHKMAITAMSLNSSYSLLVTGSEDATVFGFAVTVTETYPAITPIGFVKVPSEVTCFAWKPQRKTTLLIGCSRGDCVEVALPSAPQLYTVASYELVQCRPRAFKFHSVKSAIRRELIRSSREKEKKEKLAKKREEIAHLLAESPGLEVDEETFLMDVEEDEPLPEIYIPETPNKILMAQYIGPDVIWLSMAGFDAGYMYEYPSPEVVETIGQEPARSVMIHDADDVEIRSCLLYKERYLFLGMEHGEIRVCKWKPNNHTDLSDYWIIPMHDYYNGHIPKMVLSYDQRILFTCGHDGNLFSYEVNDDTPPEAIKFEMIRGTLSLPRTSVEDIKEIDHPTLEETIQQTERDRVAVAAKQSKQQTLEKLMELSEDYSKIIERNKTLPDSHRLTHEELELDTRITDDLNKELDAEMAAVREKLAFKIEKSELGLQKLVDHFIKPITCLPFAVCKISEPDKMVYSLRQRVLDIDDTLLHTDSLKFLHIFDKQRKRLTNDKTLSYEQEREEEQEEMARKEERDAEEETELKIKGQPLAEFLRGVDYEDTESSSRIRLNQMLRKYALRKTRLEKREKEWKAIYSKKPDISVNHAEDMLAIEEAKRTIGDYKLKSSPIFDLSEKRVTLASKYKEILNCRKKLYYLQEGFNARLKAVRTEKEQLQAKVQRLIETLGQIHAEIPLNSVKPLPVIPTTNVDIEFPERKLTIDKDAWKTDGAKESQEKDQSLILPESIQMPGVCSDEEYEILLLDKKFAEHFFSNSFFSSSEKKLEIRLAEQKKVTTSPLHVDDVESPWEREMKTARALRKIYEQDCILRHIETSCENLDKKLDQLQHERLNIVSECVSINLFLLTLRQEYVILKKYETTEKNLQDQLDNKLEEVETVKQKLQTVTDKMDVKTKEITKLRNQIKDIFSEYMSKIGDNRFRNFLCKIFKKKYKEVKEDDETTTTTTETDETESVDSKELELIYFDENVCPSGCDEELYKLAFTMRENRYSCEHQIKDLQRVVEILQKELQTFTKKLKVTEIDLKKTEDDLRIFMLKKQKELNDVDVTVVMKLHQLQYFDEFEIPPKIQDCVVFDKAQLSKLYSRIQELQEETLELRVQHKNARAHLQRIKLDRNQMRAKNKTLKNEIKSMIMIKFGQSISLNELYETIIRRMVHDIKVSLSDATKYFAKQIKQAKESYSEELNVFNKLIREHTQKLSFLTILVEEQSKLKKLSKQRIVSDEEMTQFEETYKSDITKLEKILKRQIRQKQLFMNDIKNLRLKTKIHPTQCMAMMRRSDKDIESQSEENFNQDWRNVEVENAIKM